MRARVSDIYGGNGPSVALSLIIEFCTFFKLSLHEILQKWIENKNKRKRIITDSEPVPQSQLRCLQGLVAHIHTMCLVQNISNQVQRVIHISVQQKCQLLGDGNRLVNQKQNVE